MEQRRTTGFLLGLIAVLAVLYVALEWNAPDGEDIAAVDLDELMHESELVPMSNEEVMAELEPESKKKEESAEQLRVVDDDVELTQPDEPAEVAQEGDDDETLLETLTEDEATKPLAPIDPVNPLNFHVVEDLPQFPGGAVEFMKWLTKNLRYPSTARRRKQEGKVVAVFYVEKNGSISGISITKSLSPDCDREALRVLSIMPNWQPGIQNDQPCRTKVCIPIVFKL